MAIPQCCNHSINYFNPCRTIPTIAVDNFLSALVKPILIPLRTGAGLPSRATDVAKFGMAPTPKLA